MNTGFMGEEHVRPVNMYVVCELEMVGRIHTGCK